jgi:hypothetical protein
MKTWTKLVIVGALGGGLLVGCGDDVVATPDAGPVTVRVQDTIFYIDPDTDARMELAAPDVGALVDSVPGSGTAPDLSCRGGATNVRPVETGTGTSDVTITMTVKDFQDKFVVPNAVVNFYRGNELPLAVGGVFACDDPAFPCQTGTTGADGVVTSTFTDTDLSWYAYFIKGHTGPTPAATPADTAQYNESAEATIDGNSVSMATLGIIPTILGLTRQTGTAMIAGTFYDCTDTKVRGLVVRMFREDGDNNTSTGDTFIEDAGTRIGAGYRYFNGDDFPAGDQAFSNVDGLYAGANLPAGDPIRVEAWYNSGTVTAPVPKMWGCERLRVFPNGVTMINIRPMRTDMTGCTEAP